MKIALVMNENSYCGREYLKQLKNRNIIVDVISVGYHPLEDIIENERCCGLWHPPLVSEVCESSRFYSFSSLKDDELIQFLEKKQYDLGIQGGTGILKEDIIRRFHLGILNFHPGDLPEYRGCSAPEWQLLDGKPIICTCHLVDAGIDTGKIYKKRKLFDADFKGYYLMRSQIYPRISEFVADVISNITEDFLDKCVAQDESNAVYRKYVGDDRIKYLVKHMQR